MIVSYHILNDQGRHLVVKDDAEGTCPFNIHVSMYLAKDSIIFNSSRLREQENVHRLGKETSQLPYYSLMLLLCFHKRWR